MRGVLALALALTLAGCTAETDPEPGAGTGTTEPGRTDAARPSQTSSSEAPRGTSSSSATGSATSGSPSPAPPGGEGGNGTSATYGVVVREHFEGTGPPVPPDPQAIGQVDHIVAVPAGVDHLVVYYNSTYNGLWHSVVQVHDPSGAEAMNSLDVCGLPPFPAPPALGEEYTCTMEVKGDIAEGEWTLSYQWQVGNVSEEYTLDAVGFGFT